MEPIQEKQVEMAFVARNQEIGLFWQRSVFFWGFTAAALLALSQFYGTKPHAALLACDFGLVCAMAATLANRGSKYWQQAWEDKLEAAAPPQISQMFKRVEPVKRTLPFTAARYSVSKLTIAVSDFLVGLWCVFMASVFRQVINAGPGFDKKASIALAIISVVFALSLLRLCRSTLPSDNATADAAKASFDQK